MSKILYIKANVKPADESRTFKISDAFIEEYVKNHPKDEIITIDLSKENIGFLSNDDLDDIFGPKTDETKNYPLLKHAYMFKSVDKYVVAAPMWNLSIPAILKAYIDYICVTGITFKYTEQGPVGLCTSKKAIHITTRGGMYSKEPFSEYEMGNRYLRTIFKFLGVEDFTSIHAEELDVYGKDVDAIVGNAINQAKESAKRF